MKTNTTVYAILHGQIIKTLLVGINEQIETAYIKHNNQTIRVMTDSIFPNKQDALNILAHA